MNKTKIEYLTHTWNPIAMRCTPVSLGCANCWHLAMAKRLAGNPTISKKERLAYSGGEPVLKMGELTAPLRLRKPARVGAQFMGDLFHESVPDDFLNSIFSIMQDTGEYTFFVLTKRVKRMENFLKAHWPVLNGNIWLGVSVEDQKTADERIPILLQIPATHRWVSIEPMLGPVDLLGETGQMLGKCDLCGDNDPNCPGCEGVKGIDWVVCGGETGPKARPMHLDWVRSLRDQSQVAGVSFFFKGWGEWLSFDQLPVKMIREENLDKYRHTIFPRNEQEIESRRLPLQTFRIGHKNSGRLLDGRTWEEYPKF